MSERPLTIVERAERLCTTLERIGDALITLDADTLLETEETLGQVLAAFSALTDEEVSAPVDREALRIRVVRAAAALVRCRRLGASFGGVSGARLRMRSGLETYGRDGAYVEHQVSGSAVQVTT